MSIIESAFLGLTGLTTAWESVRSPRRGEGAGSTFAFELPLAGTRYE